MLAAPCDREISGSDFRFDIEANTHNLFLLNSARLADKEAAIINEDEQKNLLHTLRENRNEVLLDTNLLEKKIVQEKKSIENVFILAERIKLSFNNIMNQLCVSENTYEQFEICFKKIENIKENFEAEHTEYMKIAIEAENSHRMLEIGSDKIRQILNAGKEKSHDLLLKVKEETSKNKEDVSQLLKELFMKEIVNDPVYLEEETTLLGAVGKMRKAYSPLAEKNNYLKKSKLARDREIKLNKENTIKENDNKNKSLNLIGDLKDTHALKQQELIILRQEKDELLDIFNLKCSLCVENEQQFDNKNKAYNDLENIEDSLVNEEVNLKLLMTNNENDFNARKSVFQKEIKAYDERITDIESEHLLLKGRIFEVSQQIEQLNSSLNEKRMAHSEKQNELSVLEEAYNKLKACCELESSVEKTKNLELEESMVQLELKINETQAEITNNEAKYEYLKNQVEKLKLNLDEDRQKKIIGEQEAIEQEKRNQQLSSTVAEMIALENNLKTVCSQLEQYDIILKDGEVLRLEMKKNYDKMLKELAEFEENITEEIEDKKKEIIQVQDEAQKQKDDLTLLEHFIEYKTSTIEQGEVEIMRLKELLREFDHNLAKSIKGKQLIAMQLANQGIKQEEELKVNQNMKKQPELKRKDVFDKKPSIEDESSEFIFSGTENIIGGTYLDTPIKAERVDDFLEPVKTVGKKFFKSRVSENKRTPIYSQIRNKKPKITISNTKKTVFDYDDDDDIQVVYAGKRM